MGKLTRIFRSAMEDTGENDTIVLKGPLSNVFADALAIALAKREHGDANNEGGDPTVAMENQQQEVAIMSSLLQKIQHGNEPADQSSPVLYAMSGPEITEQDFVDITSDMADKEDPSNVTVFIDKVDINEDGTPVLGTDALGASGKLISALESVVHRMGGKVYYSLESFRADLL